MVTIPTSPASTADALTLLHSGDWQVNSAASSIVVSHKTMWGLSTVRATFEGITGQAHDTTKGGAVGSLIVAAGSVRTKYDRLTTHLRSADFFDVAQHPTFDFVARSVDATDPDIAIVTGELTILGTTRSLSFPVQAHVETPAEVTVTGSTRIDRKDYGMAWNRFGALGGLTAVTFDLRFTRG